MSKLTRKDFYEMVRMIHDRDESEWDVLLDFCLELGRYSNVNFDAGRFESKVNEKRIQFTLPLRK